MKKLVLATGVAIVGLLSAVTPAGAWWNWCEEDPAVVIQTPGHHSVTVWVTIQAYGVSDPNQLASSVISYEAHRDATPGTSGVEMTVRTPQLNTQYVSHVIVSSQANGHGTIYAESNGYSPARTIHVSFELPVS